MVERFGDTCGPAMLRVHCDDRQVEERVIYRILRLERFTIGTSKTVTAIPSRLELPYP
jgi:hypothetical protein